MMTAMPIYPNGDGRDEGKRFDDRPSPKLVDKSQSVDWGREAARLYDCVQTFPCAGVGKWARMLKGWDGA